MIAANGREKMSCGLLCSLLMAVLPLLPVTYLHSSAYAANDQKPQQWAPAMPEKDGPKDPEAKRREYFTDLELVTHDGKKVRFYSDMLKDKVVLITAYYLSCTRACPMQNVVLNKLQRMLGDRFGKSVFFISVSVDPVNDTWDLVKEYARVWDAKSGWTFLTGKKENVDWVAYKMGLYVKNPEDHETRFILGNVKTGHWLRMPPQSTAEVLALKLAELEDENKNK